MQSHARRLTWPLQIGSVALAILLPERTSAQAVPGGVTAAGRLQGETGIMSIGTAASGIVKEILVHQGSRVHAGQLLVTISCGPTAAETAARDGQLRAVQAVLDRVRKGPRTEEIAVAEAAVGYATARAEEAQKTYERAQALREGVSVTTARVLETQRDARVFAAQLAEARAKLALLRAGSREEDIREAEARRDTASAQLEEARAQLDQCSIRAPVDGIIVDVVANAGQFMSLAVPAPLLHMVQDKK